MSRTRYWDATRLMSRASPNRLAEEPSGCVLSEQSIPVYAARTALPGEPSPPAIKRHSGLALRRFLCSQGTMIGRATLGRWVRSGSHLGFHARAGRRRGLAAARLASAASFLTIGAIGNARAQTPASGVSPTTVNGVVVELETGVAVLGATVRLRHESGSPARAGMSDQVGRFSFAGLDAGRYHLAVERIGYRVTESTMDVAGREVSVQIRLVPEAIELEGVVVVARSSPRFDRSMEGFERRRQENLYVARYIPREEIEARMSMYASLLLLGIPRVQLIPQPLGGHGIRIRGCQPILFVDGIPYRGAELDHLVRPEEIEGIEVYTQVMPAEFSGMSSGCGAIVVWTRRGAPVSVTRRHPERAVMFLLALLASVAYLAGR
jgi:hypothetical protein